MAIKTYVDPVKGNYSVLVADGNVAAGVVALNSPSIVGGKVSASLGGLTFMLSGSGMALTATLPAIGASILGKTATILVDNGAIVVSAANGLSSPSSLWTGSLAAYSTKEYIAVSGALGYYWHTVI